MDCMITDQKYASFRLHVDFLKDEPLGPLWVTTETGETKEIQEYNEIKEGLWDNIRMAWRDGMNGIIVHYFHDSSFPKPKRHVEDVIEIDGVEFRISNDKPSVGKQAMIPYSND